MPDAAQVRLVPLVTCPEALDRILVWNLEVWGSRIPGYDPSGWRAFYERCLAADYRDYDGTSELAWAILEDGFLVGSIALVHEDDLPQYLHLSPWLAAFVVDPQLRHHGIGRRAMAAFEDMVRGYGITRLYLWTDHYTHFYRSLGYQVLAHDRIADIEMDVMAKDL